MSFSHQFKQVVSLVNFCLCDSMVQDSSEYSRWSQQCCSLYNLDSSLGFKFLQSLFPRNCHQINIITLSYKHHHHQIDLSALISLVLSLHPSLSPIAPSRSSKLHLVSTQSWLANTEPSMCWVHRKTSLISSSLLLRQLFFYINDLYATTGLQVTISIKFY